LRAKFAYSANSTQRFRGKLADSRTNTSRHKAAESALDNVAALDFRR
jgi:hypothetical protein